jgi:outer membrane lipoprotein-sorting protein
MASSRRAKRLRFFAPVAAVLTIGLIALIPTLSSAATPDLPPLTAEQLITKVQQANVKAFSGTLALTADLGIPNLSGLQETGAGAGAFNPLDYLAGTHQADIKVDGPDRQAMTMTGALSETAAYHDGQNAWTWQSDGQKVTHFILPARDAGSNEQANAPAEPAEPAPTPDQLAKQALDSITPSTAVAVATPAYVADQPVYELVLAPHTADSTIDHVGISVDANKGFPLQVEVWAKGQSKPALQLGFSSIDYHVPSGPFSFTPPAGATVTTKDMTKDGHDATHAGQAPATATAAAPAPIAPPSSDLPPPGGPKHRHGFRGQRPAGFAVSPSPSAKDVTVLGEDWTQVVVANGVTLPPQAHEIFQATTPVTGSFGTARLLHTGLLNVLLLPDGRVAAGFVTPAALEAAVSHG